MFIAGGNEMIKDNNHYISKVVTILMIAEFLVLVASAYLRAAIRFIDNIKFSFLKLRKYFRFCKCLCISKGI
jgi:hypothetical protein